MTVILALTVTSCKDKDNNVAVTNITLSQSEPFALSVGSTITINATVEPADADQKLLWSSSQPEVATVVGGAVTAILPGTVTITASTYDGSRSTSVTITVTNPVVGITLQNKDVKIAVGEKSHLVYVFNPNSALNRAVTWSSDAPQIVSVDSNTGEITGLMIGSAKITVTSLENEKVTDDCMVTVLPISVTDITLSVKSLTLEVGEKKTLTYTITPSNADNQEVIWSTENPDIASVDAATGEITGIGSGKTVITVTTVDGGHTDECTVTVPSPNLLKNPGFESPDASVNIPQDWTLLPQSWFDAYYANDPAGAGTAVGSTVNRIGPELTGSDATFFTTGNGAFFGNTYSGFWAARIGANTTGGFYQIVDVTPGATYEFSIVAGFRENDDNALFKNWETLKFLSPDGLVAYHLEPIVIDNSNIFTSTVPSSRPACILTVSGNFTVPAGVTQIRFQFDQRNFPSPNQAPLLLVDDCVFRQLVN